MADALAIAELRSHAVAKSTIAQRGVAFNKWSAFCEARGCDPIRRDGMTPFNLNLAEAFIADLTITQGLQGDTAKWRSGRHTRRSASPTRSTPHG